VAASTYMLIILISSMSITSMFIASCVFGWGISYTASILAAGLVRAARCSICAASCRRKL
jgi:hypothetical protein